MNDVYSQKIERRIWFLLLVCLLCGGPSGLNAQTEKITVTGTVVDENKEPVAGANVVVKGTRIGVSTNAKGAFSLANVPPKATVIISFIGYKERVEPLNGRTRLDVVLVSDAITMEDVVVLPYGGAVAKKDLTGSVASINVQDMKKLAAVTFESAIAGKVAGVQVNMGDGQPGGLPDIVIRGSNSVTQSNAPLYVIDGILLESPDNSSIPTQNIKSIEILKDASATAIYGARGANGVVVITTNGGSIGAPKVQFDFRYSLMKDYNRYEMMSPYEFVKLQNELDQAYGSMYLDGREPHPDGRSWTLDDYRNEKAYDWQDLITQTGTMQEYGITLSGGTEKTTYSTSFNFTRQNGIIINTGMRNYVGNVQLNQKLGKNFNVNVQANYAEKERNGLQVNYGSGSAAYMYKVWSYRPIDTKGIDLTTELQDPDAIANNIVRFNPLLQARNMFRQYFTRQLRSSVRLSWNILPCLKLSSSLSLTYTNSEDNVFNNSKTEAGSILPGRNDGINGSRRNVRKNDLLNENTLNFHKKFADKHDLSLTAGITQQTNRQDIFEARATQIPQSSEWRGMEALDEGKAYQILSKKYIQWAMVSYLFRANYNYRNKYYLTYTVRADGSSKFTPENRWGYFHSGAARWRFTEEKFFKKKVKWLSDGSLNLSYGSTGNNGVGEYSYLPQIGFSAGSTYYDYSFNGAYPSSGAIVQTIGNPDLKWETTYTLNGRLDLGFLDQRIQLIAEYYWKDTKDLLINASLPAHLGYSTAYRNVGRVENKGFELSLSTVNVLSRKFRWTSDLNLSFNRNKVLELANDQTVLPSDQKIPNGASLYIARVGQPIGMMYGALTDGLYQYEDFDRAADGGWILKGDRPSQSTTTNRKNVIPGYQRFKDLNNDLQITQDDMTIIGNPNPDFTGGFTNNLEFANFDLQLFFTFSYGNDILNMNRFYLEEGRQISSNQFASYADRWTVDNPDGKLPRVRSANNTAWSCDRFVEDGSYLRLRNLNLGYTLPAAISQKFYVSRLRVYFSAQNLWTWTRYSGQDPTINTLNNARTPGYDYSAYPIPRTFVFGVQASF